MTRPVFALNAPVRSLEMLELQIEAGATEIYVGLGCDELKVLTFNARAQSSDEQPCQVSSPRLLKDLIQFAHEEKLSVNFSANIQHLPTAFHPAYVDHVKRAVDMGVDNIVVANMGLMKLLRASGIALPFTAAGYMNVGTVRLARYLGENFGVTRVTLPHAMALEEVSAFTRLPGIEIEIPVQTGAGNTCGRCMMSDSPVTPEIGLGCRAGYEVREGGSPSPVSAKPMAFLDGSTDCSLCSVIELISAGVFAFKIPGRESPNLRVNAKMTQLYRKAIDDALSGKAISVTIQEIDRVELLWQMRWVPRFCNEKRCRFRETATTQSYV